MKKLFLLAAVCAVGLSSCSKNENGNDNPPPGTLTFEITAVNTIGTRANLYSQEAIHEVERVSVYVFKETGSDFIYLKTFDMPSWAKGSNFKRLDVPTEDMVPQGKYKFLAVGRDLTDNFTLPELTGLNYNNFLASVSAAGRETEIFAGTKEATVASQGMRIPISITRQVAGVLGYFKNVPADIEGSVVRYLRLTISNSNTNVNLTTGAGTVPTGTGYNLINVDFDGVTVNQDGAYVGNTNDLSALGIITLPNSQLNGAFVIPVNAVTLTLGLYDEGGAPLKTWTVLNETTATSYNIQANHFYALGTKVSNGSTGGTPEDPTPDNPIDLMKDQAITVTITPNWTQIHNMTLQ